MSTSPLEFGEMFGRHIKAAHVGGNVVPRDQICLPSYDQLLCLHERDFKGREGYAYGVYYITTQSLTCFLLSFSSAKQMCQFLPKDLVFILSMFLAFTLRKDQWWPFGGVIETWR